MSEPITAERCESLRRYYSGTSWMLLPAEAHQLNILALCAALSEARRDTERLDWMDRNTVAGDTRCEEYQGVYTVDSYPGNSLREAIDMARSAALRGPSETET
jgi:hypothetical protein